MLTRDDPAAIGEATGEARRAEPGLLFSVIVPVYDQANVIVENVRVIRDRVAAGLDGPFEVIVVSDGSLDGTAERVLESDLADVRVLYYDRNLGKGYAIKTGAREARGRWVGYVDADLDLDPAALPGFVSLAEREQLDFVIGSKRHPDSEVHYPSSRVAASWLYQQLVRVLFGLDVRDTQVGLKVFRREIAQEVLPLLLVKRYAFDIEMLAVANALGHGRVREMPIVLDYRFSGSGVRSLAVAHAVFDTLAVFYRLRVLGHYQRRLARDRSFAWATAQGGPARSVGVVSSEEVAGRRLAAEAADREILAFLEPGANPSANWLSSTLPLFASPQVAAVVTPQLAPAHGDDRSRAAAAIAESRVGGSLRFRFTPGALRFVADFPASSYLVRRDAFLALDPATPPEEVVHALSRAGGRTVYLPEASVTIPPAPLFRAHLRRIATYGRARGSFARRQGGSKGRASTVAAVVAVTWTLLGWLLAALSPLAGEVWLASVLSYLAIIGSAACFSGLRFHSLRVGALAALGLPLTHLVYAAAFVSGFARGTRHARPAGTPPSGA